MISDGEGLTFGGLLDTLAAEHGDRPAILSSDVSNPETPLLRRSYGEFAADVVTLQAALTELGIRPGERVGVFLSSVPEWIVYMFAVVRLGGIFLPINPRFGSHDLDYVLRHSGAAALVAMGQYMGRDHAALIAQLGELPALRHITGVRTPPTADALMTDALIARGRALIAADGPPVDQAMPDDIAILFYTSGTTDFPKGVPLSHANLLPHTLSCGALLDLTPEDRVLSLYPFFGVSGGANKILSTFGAAACLMFQDAFRAEEAFDLLVEERASVLHAVDVQIRELVQIADVRGPPSTPRRATIAFMASLDEDLARRMGPALGIDRFIHPYGMTETNPMILRNALDDPFPARVRAGGRVAEHVELRVIDPETGADRGIDEPGEIVVRGPTVMRGYFQDDTATNTAFRDGWFHTGDFGVRSADGFVFYTGRLKDMLKVGGFNVAPQEVEAYMREHPAIEDVAVTGAADARLGEVPVAFVRLRAGSVVDAETLLSHCRGHLANFKVPRQVWLVDELPYHTAANGSKLQRHVLRTWAAERNAGELTRATDS